LFNIDAAIYKNIEILQPILVFFYDMYSLPMRYVRCVLTKFAIHN